MSRKTFSQWIDAQLARQSTGPKGAPGRPIRPLPCRALRLELLEDRLVLSPAPFVSFTNRQDFATGERPFSLTLGDLNCDGKSDIALANMASASVSVLLNTTTPGANSPTFGPRADFDTGTAGCWPRDVALGDLNGDGKLDLAVANDTSSSVSILLNTTLPGATVAAFTAKQDFATTGRAFAVALKDVNGDGKLDLVAANVLYSNTVSVLLNTTTPGDMIPSFAAKHDFATGSRPESVSLQDINGDGMPDITVANRGSDTISVLLNTTTPGADTPSFAAKQDLGAGSGSGFVGARDLNGDGKADLVVANRESTTVSVLLNTTAPGASTPSFAAKQDFTTASAGANPYSVSLGDLNGDGKLDLAVANRLSTTVSVLLNTTSPGSATCSFAPKWDFTCGTNPKSVSMGDLNGDGKQDLAVANYGSYTVSVLLNTTGTGNKTVSFAAKKDFATGYNTRMAPIGDLNNDGKPDMAVAVADSNLVSVLLNTTTLGSTTPSFAAKQDLAAGSSPGVITLADLNGDGKLDIGVTNWISKSISVFLNTTSPGSFTATFAPRQDFTDFDGPGILRSGDLNGDGKPDLAVANRYTNNVSVLLNTTSPGANAASFARRDFAAVSGASDLVLTDLNADGKTDLAVGCNFYQAVLFNLTTPGSTTADFGNRQDLSPGTALDMMGDLNGDGKPDFVGRYYWGEIVSVLLNTTAPGATTLSFGPKYDFATGGRTDHVALVDMNGDGKQDLVVDNQSGSAVAVLLNTTPTGGATPTFAVKQNFSAGSGRRSVSAGDLNGDGRPDLTVANKYSGSVSVLINTTSVLAMPTVTVTANGGVRNGNPFPATDAAVTGWAPDGVIASFGDSTLTYTYFSGTTPLAGPPWDIGIYSVVARYTSNNPYYTDADSPAVTFTIEPGPNLAPRDISISRRTVWEGQPAGTVVGTFSTRDLDTGDTFRYSLVDGEGGSDNSSFSIDASGRLLTAATFDHSSQLSCSIRVRTTDQGELWYDEVFTIDVVPQGTPPCYYVNDSSTANDEWCTAMGNDANDGLSPSAPKATVQAVLDAYDLGPGDVVRIDTGTYALAANLVVGTGDSGDSSAPVRFEASPYGVTIQRGNTSTENAYAWEIAASYVTLSTARGTAHPALAERFMRVTNGYCGVFVTGDHCTIERSEVYGNGGREICLQGVNASNATVRNCLVRGGTSTFAIELYVDDADQVRIENCTLIAGNGTNVIYLRDSNGTSIFNNIIVASGTVAGEDRFAFNFQRSTYAGDYNDIFVSNGATFGHWLPTELPTLSDWRSMTGGEQHSLSQDPLFVDPANGDYHVKSTGGSYHNGAWTADAISSCAIDTGFGDTAAEPTPNSSAAADMSLRQRNLGAYGGTEQASKTPTERKLYLYAPEGPDILSTAIESIRWAWAGSDWQTGDTVRLQWSADGGTTLQDIEGAQNTVFSAGQQDWNISSYVQSNRYRLKISANADIAASDQSRSTFQVRFDTHFTYYVNDSSIINDNWCTAVGSDSNDGTTPATPMAGIQSVVNAYKLRAGDTVYIDTGSYSYGRQIWVGASDFGESGRPVTFAASPYGVTFTSTASFGYTFWLCSPYVVVTTAESNKYPNAKQSWMKLRGSPYGVGLQSTGLELHRLDLSDGYWHNVFVRTAGALIDNCIIWKAGSSSGAGVRADASVTVRNCTIFDNPQYGVHAFSSITLENNVIWADGAGRYAVYISGGSQLTSDYNDLYASGGANVGYFSGSPQATLSNWQSATGTDSHSLSADPLLANRTSGDAHLLSAGGRYDPALGLPPSDSSAWVIDTSTSPCIDGGNPLSAYSGEPIPNRRRVNLGAYGNTEQASLTFCHAPVLDDTGTMALSGISEDDTDNPGTLISGVIASAGGDRITDLEPGALEGIAVVAVDDSNGTWQYSLNGGSAWFNFDTPSEAAARLLASDTNTRVRFVPDSNWNGPVGAGITFRAWDQTSGTNGGTADTRDNGWWTAFSTATETAAIVVSSTNDLPTISNVADRTVRKNTSSGPIGLAVGDVETAAADLTVTASSSDPELVPVGNIAFGGDGANRTMTITPATDRIGTTTITLTVADNDGGSTSCSFVLTVNLNYLPTLSDLVDQIADEDTPTGPLTFTVADTETPAASLVLTGQSSNLALVPEANVIFGDAGADRTIRITPAPNQFGAATITVTLTDDEGGTAVETFLLTVNPVNDPPAGTDVTRTIEEDGTYTFLASDFGFSDPLDSPANAFQGVRISTLADHGTLTLNGTAVTTGQLVSVDDLTAGHLAFSPAGNAVGSPYASFAFQVQDDGGTALGGIDVDPSPRTFSITVTGLNDAPTSLVLLPATVQENRMMGTAVGSFSSTDPDAGDDFVYALVSGPGDDDNVRFTVSGGQLVTAVVFDFEAGSLYSVRVRTTDSGGLHLETVIPVSITDVNWEPAGLELSAVTVLENLAAGVIVGTLTSVDNEPPLGPFVYALASGEGSASNGLFTIAGDGLYTATVFNYEAQSTHSIRIRTTDQGGLWYEKTFTITVVDVNEAPASLGLSANIAPENASTGTVIGTLSATDPDSGDAFTYTLLNSADGRFTIVGDQLQVDQGRLLDYETATSHTIRVRTTDQGGTGLTYEQDLVIAITDLQDYESIGLFDPTTSVFYLRNTNSTGLADYTFGYGDPSQNWTKLVGDWDGNAQDTIGFFDPDTSTWYLRNSLTAGYADWTFGYGDPSLTAGLDDRSWMPIVGDWDGNGTDTIGFFDPASCTWYLRNSLTAGYADWTFGYGDPGLTTGQGDRNWVPIVGDWDGNNTDTIGFFDPATCTWYLRNSLTVGYADWTFGCGDPSLAWGHGENNWAPTIGDWDGNNTDTIGFFDPAGSVFMLRNSLTTGAADVTFGYGAPGAGWQAMTGCWWDPSQASVEREAGNTLNASAVDQLAISARPSEAGALTELETTLTGLSQPAANATDWLMRNGL